MKQGTGRHRTAINLTVCLLVVITASACFPHKAGRRLAHFDSTSPAVGVSAPDFELQDIHGNTIRLGDIIGDKPVVLQLGSHSCPVYRYRRFGMASLYNEYKDKAKFLLVYTLEAHPVGTKSPYADREWLTWWNRFGGVRVPQAVSADQRHEQARYSHDILEVGYTMVTDQMDNSTWRAYGAASSPAFVINREGQIALKQVWLNPKKIRETLDVLLSDE